LAYLGTIQDIRHWDRRPIDVKVDALLRDCYSYLSNYTMASMMLAQDAMTSTASPSHSSPESFEVETVDDDIGATQLAHWQQTSPNSKAQPPRPSAPLLKRRRVTRACDECRRKKIKCDGKQPCKRKCATISCTCH